eukprot:comp22658_c0_seq1/m.34960 comp22658_c0_seq1/g.34960  ORF comp22658_c0_seq1/g.34960 comp22658_c0_seq1/m.34960 type:complete len:422 (-) comp22658_c0_seq1:279-1544(-)
MACQTLKMKSLLLACATTLLLTPSVQACSDFQLRYPIASDQRTSYTVSARTIDWGNPDMYANLHAIPEGTEVELMGGKDCNDCAITKVTAKYGHVYVDTMYETRAAMDGLNTAGLSGAFLELFKGTLYPKHVREDTRPALASYSLIDYMLAMCDTVDCVKKELAAHQVVEGSSPALNMMGGSYGAHFQFHDRVGKSLVVEFIGANFSSFAPLCFNSTEAMHKYAEQAGARVCVYDNVVKVMTNDPNFEQMIANLTGRLGGIEYEDISTVPNATIAEVLRTSGGFTPNNRFAHLAMLQELGVRNNGEWVLGTDNDKLSFAPINPRDDHISAATAMIGRVTVAKGLVELEASGLQDWTTAYTFARDHVHGLYYFNTPAIRNMRVVDLSKLVLGKDGKGLKRKSLPLAKPLGPKYEDVSIALWE